MLGFRHIDFRIVCQIRNGCRSPGILAVFMSTPGSSAPAPLSAMLWRHEPRSWKAEGEKISMIVDPGTDYWRVTHYGFIRDNGPFRFQQIAGDFEAKVSFSGRYRELYHQAGLMLRLDEKNWIKAGVEYVDNVQNVSAVVTRDFSDWSVIPQSGNPEAVWLRLRRQRDTVHIDYSLNGKAWSMIRLAYFPASNPVEIGLVAAAPGKEEFSVIFERFSLTPPLQTE